MSLLCLTPGASAAPFDPLAKRFVTPLAPARAWIYWPVFSGNLTEEGTTADFEAMARVGVGGVLDTEMEQWVSTGVVDFAGPLLMEMFSHACK